MSPRPQARDMAKELHWRELLAEFKASDLGPSRFCRNRNLPLPMFYRWRNKIAARDIEIGRKSKYNSRRKTGSVAKSSTQHRQTSAEFAEVHLTNTSRNVEPEPISNSNTPALEIVLASGINLRIASHCSMNLLAAVVTVLENR